MREFLRGWKRKAAVVTLAMACLFALGCVRSLVTYDELISPHVRCISSNGRLYFEISRQEWGLGYHYNSAGPNVKGRHDLYADPKMVSFWRWRGLGFAYRSKEYDIDDGRTPSKVTVIHFMFPFWSIVLPLTLVSAWLLLSKPRASNPKPASEP